MDRRKIALRSLKKWRENTYFYLGEGKEAIIFTDKKFVYKIFIPLDGRTESIENWKFTFLKCKAGTFRAKKHLINYEYLILDANNNVRAIRYPYFPYKRVKAVSWDEAISFLVECWREKVVFKDVKLSNFIRTNGILKYVDYGLEGFETYTDNLFTNMAARIYIDVKYPNMNEEERVLLKRSCINNFNLPELEGFHDFLTEVFSRIIYEESEQSIMTFRKQFVTDLLEVHSNDELINKIKKINSKNLQIMITSFEELNFEHIFWKLLQDGLRLTHVEPVNISFDKNGYHCPKNYLINVWRLEPLPQKVTLLIKACPQESSTLYWQVKHIIKQLLAPNPFYERVIAIDKKEKDFLRQYNSNGSLEDLYKVINQLIAEGIIDYYIELPEDEIEDVNYRWFRIRTKETHTTTKIPVTPQLYAFEKVKGEYILQMDSDVLIGRIDYRHSFLRDMIKALEENEHALSVGFNIPKRKIDHFVKYHAPKGGYKPEVRFALIHRQRLLESRPWPNTSKDGKLTLSWYQSLHLHQQKTEYQSLRGGDPKSFYIHPQNYRKRCADVWATILDRIEKNIIPDIQREQFDLMGSYYDWTIPKRNEKFVIITLMRNVSYSRFLRAWNSIVSQDHADFGWIIIDDASGNGIEFLVESLIKKSEMKDRITFIKNRIRVGILANTYKAIHYFVENPESIIVIVDGDDALIGKNVITLLDVEYSKTNADVIIGKMYRTDKLWAHYPYRPNFYNPRLYGGNVWQHLRSFKKYLFDSIKLVDLRYEKKPDNFISSSIGSRWFEYCADYAYMIPIIEMASNPQFFEYYNYFHERTTPNTKNIRKIKDEIIGKILSRPKYSKDDVIKNGRRKFTPNLKKIEIDITYRCNLKCIACNRSCSQVDSDGDFISLYQIKRFIEESIRLNIKWEMINLLGGEPTLHPDFIEIVKLILNEYILKFSQKTILQITSNGYSRKTREILEKLPTSKNLVINKNSFKESNRIIYFTPFNKAPIDLEEVQQEDFSKGCWVTAYCGIGLNRYGYYPCGVAGGIDRVIGLDIGIKTLEDVINGPSKLVDLLNVFCKYCGNFVDYRINKGNFIPRCEKNPFIDNIITKSWKEIYRKYNEKKPSLKPIYEEK